MLEGDPLQQTLMGLQCHRVRLSWASLEARWDNTKVFQKLNSKQHNVCPPIFPPSPHPADSCCPLLSGFLLQPLLLSSVLSPQLCPVRPCQTFPWTHPASPNSVLLSHFTACTALSHSVFSPPKWPVPPIPALRETHPCYQVKSGYQALPWQRNAHIHHNAMPAALLAASRSLEKGVELCYKVVLDTVIPSLIHLQVIYAEPKSTPVEGGQKSPSPWAQGRSGRQWGATFIPPCRLKCRQQQGAKCPEGLSLPLLRQFSLQQRLPSCPNLSGCGG